MPPSRSGRSQPTIDEADAPDRSAPPQPDNEQLERILRSETFQKSDKLRSFLLFIVREAAAGRAAQLKEYVIGIHVFRKEDSFDPRTDPLVRVQARRLRAKLARYYREEGRGDPTIIELPKGSYVPVLKHRDNSAAPKRSVSTTLVTGNTVAVLPFADHGVGAALSGICSGVREEVIHHLTRLPGLRILAAHGGDTHEHAANAGGGGAALIISGSVRRAGDRLRITINLIDGASGCYLWSESVDGSMDDIFGAQELAARAVAARVVPAGTDAAARSGANRPVANLAAEGLHLQGRYHLNQRTEEGIRKAIEFFERALGEDAQYAAAHSGLSDAYRLLAHYGVRRPRDVWAQAAASARTAVRLDDFSVEAHTSLAHVMATQDWNWAGAEQEFLRAIGLDPRYATAHHWYAASCLAPLGRLAEAVDEVTLAQALDPISSIVARDVAMIHFYRRDYETALEQSDHAIELNPHFAPAYWLLGLIQAQRRDFDESLAALQRAVHLSPQTPRMHGALGRTFALAGRRKAALEVLHRLESYANERYVSPLEFAWIRFALDDMELGFHWLTKACEDRSFDLVAVRVDPRFDPFRDDERFVALMHHLGLE